MIVIREKQEEASRKIIDHHREDNYRCAYIPADMLLTTDSASVEKICQEYLGSADCYFVAFQTGDLLLFAKNLSLRNFGILREKICWPEGETGRTTFLDVKRDAKKILYLLEQKEAARYAAQAERAAAQAAENRRAKTEIIINTPIDHRLIETLQQRRRARERVSVLVVEDEPFTRQLVSTALGANVSFLSAATGEEVIPTYLENAPDVVFLDIGLPDINGQQILKKLVSIDPNAFVVMLSGQGNHENVVNAAMTGARGFISKPFTREKLFQYVNKCEKLSPIHA